MVMVSMTWPVLGKDEVPVLLTRMAMGFVTTLVKGVRVPVLLTRMVTVSVTTLELADKLVAVAE
jgi:hypothetical protein